MFNFLATNLRPESTPAQCDGLTLGFRCVQRRRKWRRKRAEQRVYVELSEAMDCLDHICTEGCTEVGPAGRAPAPSPCARYATCRGLQLLIRHFSQCHRKSCARCQRMWQLLRLHSALCDRPDRCNTPLCT